MKKNEFDSFILRFNLCDFDDLDVAKAYIAFFPDLNRYVVDHGATLKPGVNSVTYTVDPDFKDPFPLDLRDLARLHFLTCMTKPLSILELGSGHSTFFFAHALELLSRFYSDDVENFNRINPAFHLHTVDESLDFLSITEKRLSKFFSGYVSFYQSDVELVEYGFVPVTRFASLPNVAVDLMYVDGPSQFAVPGNESVGGLAFAEPFRFPISADVLRFEYFFEPGAVVLFDGRTTNARFIENALSRPWVNKHFTKGDFSIFFLEELPLGELSRIKCTFRGLLVDNFLVKPW